MTDTMIIDIDQVKAVADRKQPELEGTHRHEKNQQEFT
jgi:hypothetical protein